MPFLPDLASPDLAFTTSLRLAPSLPILLMAMLLATPLWSQGPSPAEDTPSAPAPAAAASTAPPAAQPAAAQSGENDRFGKPLPVSGWRDLDPLRFPVPQELLDNIALWTKVYTEYDNNIVLLHDDLHMSVIYAALDFQSVNEDPRLSNVRRYRLRRERITKAKEKYKSILADLAAGRISEAYPRDQERIATLFEKVPGDRRKYTAASERIRTQTCLRNRFAEAIERSGRYMPEMERIFRRHGLPIELTRLPFVESLFQINAHSKAAAGGIWQFVPGTAKSYMKMSAESDERYDPLRATDAAARLLADNYAALGSWPLAVTAYNHGRYGMKRAVRRLGTTDLGEITRSYRSRSFGFASRNFYSEFVAAYRAYENRQHFFPKTVPDPPHVFEEVDFGHYVPLQHLADAAKVEVESLKTLNPALSSELWAGQLYFPKSYLLRVPAGSSESFRTAYANLPSNKKSAHQVGLRYRVRSGDTLGAIARRHGTSVRALQKANRLRGHLIRVGQNLLIPPNGSVSNGGITVTSAPQTSPQTYVVRRGDSLSRIASRFGTSVSALKSTNGLRNANRVTVGQRLTIPAGASSGASSTHVVRRGETLAAIAKKYGTTVRALQRANKIRGHLIKPSQILVIP